MNNLLKHQFIDVVNEMRIGTAPEWHSEPNVRYEDINDCLFDVVDSRQEPDSIKKIYNQGTASYINGANGNTYNLRFISFDDFLHQFVYDDGMGNTRKSMFKQHKKMADLLVYNTEDDKKYFIVQELCQGNASNKRSKAKIQLSSTVNILCSRSREISHYITSFPNKICYLSIKEEQVPTPNNIADGFMEAYNVIPEKIPFKYGQIGTYGFTAYETRIVKLEK